MCATMTARTEFKDNKSLSRTASSARQRVNPSSLRDLVTFVRRPPLMHGVVSMMDVKGGHTAEGLVVSSAFAVIMHRLMGNPLYMGHVKESDGHMASNIEPPLLVLSHPHEMTHVFGVLIRNRLYVTQGCAPSSLTSLTHWLRSI